MIFVSDNQSSKCSHPGESALDYISSPVAIPESVILSIDVFIVFAIRHEEIHPFLPHTVSGKLAVVALISDHSRGVGAWSSRSFLWDSDVCHDFVKEPDLSRRGRVGMASQGNTLAIDHHQVLRPFAPFGFPDCRAPFFAGTNVASTNASSQLRMPCSSSSERKARHMSLSTPVSPQPLKRRQQVEGSGYMAGKSFHLAPVLRIQRIPSRHSRSSAGGRPPLGFLRRLGSNGSIFLHCSSVNIGTRTLIGLPPKSDIRELNRHYNHLVHARYRALTSQRRFCNHF